MFFVLLVFKRVTMTATYTVSLECFRIAIFIQNYTKSLSQYSRGSARFLRSFLLLINSKFTTKKRVHEPYLSSWGSVKFVMNRQSSVKFDTVTQHSILGENYLTLHYFYSFSACRVLSFAELRLIFFLLKI